MPKKEKVSIIIPSYNSGETLSLALASIFLQKFKCIEVIVVDGGSNDNTLEILTQCKSDNFSFISERDTGIYDAMNKGLDLSSGDWIFFLGADDKLHDDNVILDMIDHRDEAIKYDAILGDVIHEDGKLRRSDVSRKMLFINTIHHQSVFYRKELFDEFRYNDKYKVSADYELNLLLYLQKRNILKRKRIVSVIGLSGVSANVDFGGYLEEIKIRNKYLQGQAAKASINFITLGRYLLKKTFGCFGVRLNYYN